jgi:hypothetical protein
VGRIVYCCNPPHTDLTAKGIKLGKMIPGNVGKQKLSQCTVCFKICYLPHCLLQHHHEVNAYTHILCVGMFLNEWGGGGNLGIMVVLISGK